MKIKMKYTFMFKNGLKEEVLQDATEAEHLKVIQLVQNAFQNETKGFVSFGGEGIGRYIRLTDLSQMETEIIE